MTTAAVMDQATETRAVRLELPIHEAAEGPVLCPLNPNSENDEVFRQWEAPFVWQACGTAPRQCSTNGSNHPWRNLTWYWLGVRPKVLLNRALK